jgi:hypothetical protein
MAGGEMTIPWHEPSDHAAPAPDEHPEPDPWRDDAAGAPGSPDEEQAWLDRLNDDRPPHW